MYGQITDPMQLMAGISFSWKTGELTDYSVSVGKSGKYMKKWLSMFRLFYNVSKRVAEQVIVNLIRNNEGISKAGGIHNGIDQGLHEG